MKFTVDDGKGLPSRIPDAVQKMIRALEALPDGKLLTTKALSVRTGHVHGTLQHHTAHPAMDNYRLKLHRTLCYFGNPKTITAARKEFSK